MAVIVRTDGDIVTTVGGYVAPGTPATPAKPNATGYIQPKTKKKKRRGKDKKTEEDK